MCGTLYEPTNFDAVYNGLSKISRQHNLGDLFVGINGVKTEHGEVYYYYLTNSTHSITRESEFIDNELGVFIYAIKEIGHHFPILLDTDSNYRFNLFTIDTQPNDQHSSVCQNNLSEEKEYFGPTSKNIKIFSITYILLVCKKFFFQTNLHI